MKLINLSLALLMLSSSYAFATGSDRQPILVTNQPDFLALTRTETPDNKIFFETCRLPKIHFQSDEALYAYVNSDSSVCVTLGNDPINLNDPKALESFTETYQRALTQEYNQEGWTNYPPVLMAYLATLITGVGVFAVIEPYLTNNSATVLGAGVVVTSVAGTIMALRWSLGKHTSLPKGPPSRVQNEIGTLSPANEVTNPKNVAPQHVFKLIERALITALTIAPADPT